MELISQEFIKPISPTPNHLKSYEYSVIDQVAISNYIPILLYYPALSDDNQQEPKAINSLRLKHLKKSLSEILAHYYPLAGRLNTTCVDCNDEGVPFLEAFVHNQRLEDILNNPDENYKTIKSFLPLNGESLSSSFLLLVQVTSFECGGMVVGVSATHKILDISCVITFLTDWATLARQVDDPNNNFVLPQLVPLAKLFPPRNNEVSTQPIETDATFPTEPCRINIYVFNLTSIANLKIKAASENISTPSRVDVVTSIMWKCLTAYSDRPSLLLHPVNLRKRFDPPMDGHHIGNFVGFVVASKQGSEKDISNMVVSLRKGLFELDHKYVKRLKGDQDEANETILEMISDHFTFLASIKDDVDFYKFTSWCGFSFYDVDFGWGKPILFSSIPVKCKNLTVLIDTKDGGVEACLCLSEDDMKKFEKNTKLLNYATLKASVPV